MWLWVLRFGFRSVLGPSAGAGRARTHLALCITTSGSPWARVPCSNMACSDASWVGICAYSSTAVS